MGKGVARAANLLGAIFALKKKEGRDRPRPAFHRDSCSSLSISDFSNDAEAGADTCSCRPKSDLPLSSAQTF